MNHEAGQFLPMRSLPAPVPEPPPPALRSTAAPQICFFHVYSCSNVLPDAETQKISCSSGALTNEYLLQYSQHAQELLCCPHVVMFMMKAMRNLSTV